jgi:hypothetical protein
VNLGEKYTASSTSLSPRGKPPTIGRRGKLCLLDVSDTTWYRRRLSVSLITAANPVASSGCAEPLQRAERGGPKWLKVRANPPRNRASAFRPDRLKRRRGCQLMPAAGRLFPPDPWDNKLQDLKFHMSCRSGGYAIYAVMPLDVLGRTRVTLTEPASSPLAERPG